MEDFVGVDEKGGTADDLRRLKKAQTQRTYREQNPEKRKLYNKRGRKRSKKRRAAFRQMTDAYKASRGCVDCGEKNPIVLDFDHLGKKLFDIANGVGRNPNTLAAEVAKCLVRCANCHRLKTHERRRAKTPWKGKERRRRILAVFSAQTAENNREDFLKFYFLFWAKPD